MARGRTQMPRSAGLTSEETRAAIPRLEARITELRNLDLGSILSPSDERIEQLRARILSTLSQIYGPDTLEYGRLKVAGDLYISVYHPILHIGRGGQVGPSPDQIREGLVRGRNRAIALLDGEVASLRESVPQEMEAGDTESDNDASKEPCTDIFIVHGHDDAAKTEVALFIERAGLKPIILHDQVDAGQTIIEKFERHGGAAGFAVVVLTPDDVGGVDRDHLLRRARQNVIGEMFWFAGRLGRDRVCALVKGDIEMPSDFAGVVYSVFDDHGGWKVKLRKELRAAGYAGDWERALG
jgi:predicted nucleotide-binding protein